MKKAKFSLTIALALILMLTCLAGSLEFANASDPPSEHRNVASVVDTAGDVQNAWSITGEADGGCATMISYYVPAGFPLAWSPPSNTAIVVGEMNDWAIGEIWIRCCKPTAGYPDFGMMVYTSNDAENGPWNLVGTFWVTGSSLNWYAIESVTEPGYTPSDWPEGYAPEPYRYIALAIMSTSPDINGYVYVDAVAAGRYVPPPLPPPPICYSVTVNIRDNSGNPLAGNIYIDGYLVGHTSVTINLMRYYQIERSYELFVTIDDSENYVFHNYTANNGEYTTNNPTPIYVTQSAIVTAYFGPPAPPVVYHSVTVDANEGGPYSYNVLRVDGTTHSLGMTFSLAEGTHTFSVDSYINCNYWCYVFLYFTCDGNTYYSNEITLPVSSDMTIVAHYYLYMYWP